VETRKEATRWALNILFNDEMRNERNSLTTHIVEIRQMKETAFFEDISDLAESRDSLSTPEISKQNRDW
jgi:hypothetical protein